MRILLTNDDGYDAEGLQAVYSALSARHEVLVAAPDSQRSAVGHGVSFHKGFHVRPTPQGYALSGTPADCVKWAIVALKRKYDLVVSGINRGANLGVDVHYSGTDGAAMEAVFYGMPAVALSCLCKEFKDSAFLGELSLKIIERLAEDPLPPRRLLNVNFPNLSRGDKVEYAVAPMGFQFNEEELEDRGEGEFFYSGYYGVHLPKTDSDLDEVYGGKVCLTPLTWDLTDHQSLSHVRRLIP